jgi:uracil-DNA glycosylase
MQLPKDVMQEAIWREFVKSRSICSRCRNEGLLDQRSFPIFAKHPPRSFDILFILEAPNRDDTYNPNKGYLTVDPLTDPSGEFFHDLFTNELRFPLDDLFITNSVLCLPAEKKAGEFPVYARQRSNCLPILHQMIKDFSPIVVCPVGTKALLAMEQIYHHGLQLMKEAVAKTIPWYGRILFPLFHTSRRARNPRNGRPEPQQRADWRSLRAVWEHARAV